MSRRFERGTARRVLVRLSAAVAATAAGAVVFSGVAAADPAPAAPPSLQGLLGELTKNAPQASDLLGGLLGAPGVTEIIEGVTGQEVGTTTAKDFLFPAPTFGCGVAGNPMTVTVASAQAGPNFPLPPWIERGKLRFQAVPAHLAIPKESDLQVAWFNTTTLKGGVVPLDDAVLNVPTLSKTVDTGEGNVLAALFGQVKYESGTTCTALGTVGQFTA
ncbi:hypothetical protein EGT67_14585 [Prescottella agglutinans]|uniref:Secreted protein n=1 Tax=Prescottella agglutinans TaxID=1644129 RepID=A0A438BCM5_9NOCA|nr:hypothetical protein [Prescottella agglutinans]RVW08749.1 hypothetical protein EGT67_14585 [Prescottella agglutinans]